MLRRLIVLAPLLFPLVAPAAEVTDFDRPRGARA